MRRVTRRNLHQLSHLQGEAEARFNTVSLNKLTFTRQEGIYMYCNGEVGWMEAVQIFDNSN